MPSSNPSTAMEMVISVDPLEMTETATRASTIIAAYSADWKLSATRDRIGEKSAITMTLTHPAKKDPMAEMNNAGPARPCRAIGCPSMQMTTEVGSPGMFSMIAVVEPAWVRAVVDARQHDQRGDRRHLEGDRQQHRDRGDGSEARQHPHQRPERRADKTVKQVLRRGGDTEPGAKIGKNVVHGRVPRRHEVPN